MTDESRTGLLTLPEPVAIGGGPPPAPDDPVAGPVPEARFPIGTATKLVISGGLIAYILLQTEPREILAALLGATPIWSGAQHSSTSSATSSP